MRDSTLDTNFQGKLIRLSKSIPAGCDVQATLSTISAMQDIGLRIAIPDPPSPVFRTSE